MTARDELLWRRWEEVDHLLDEALDLPADRRTPHVIAQAGADEVLRDLVLRLLVGLDGEDARVVAPSEAVIADAFRREGDPAPAGDIEPGTPVGHYVITRRLGRGGMATVYEGRRSDGVYDQRVAVKVLRRGLDSDDLISRFLTERRILSTLSHPNMARLLDGGSLPDGRPYLVMELVDGRRITDFADEERLDLTARLHLFLDVAAAVQAAHRQLVVHRDIKPSNILVDGDGRVKLLDFGIAKLLAGPVGHTDSGTRVLTPDYASPEQLRGGMVSIGTDIYQLGLLLRELMTGVRPQSFADVRSEDTAMPPSRAVRLELKDGPSAAERAGRRGTTPERLSRLLREDLDVLIGKALRHDPEERYASVEEMAADVRRHLGGLPIVAHPESTAYRVRKFLRRRPLVLPAVAAVLLALVAFVSVLALQNRRIAAERDAARLATRRAVATQDFLVDILRSPDPGTDQTASRDRTVLEALEQGRARMHDELAEEPELRAALLEAMGRTYTGLGRYETSDTLFHQALDLLEQIHGPGTPQAVGVLSGLADRARFIRDFRLADSILQEELRLRSAADPVDEAALADRLVVLSAVRRDLGDVDSALVLAGRSVAVLRAAGDTAGRLTQGLSGLAYALRGAGQLDSAETVYRQVLRRLETAGTTPPVALATVHNNLGYLLRTREDYEGAERAYLQAIDLATRQLGQGHPTVLTYQSNLAAVLEFQGRLDAAAEMGRARVNGAEQQWPDGHWRVAEARHSLGRFLLRAGRGPDALPWLESSTTMYRTLLGTRHLWTVLAEADLGTGQLAVGQRDDGAATLDRALAVLEQDLMWVPDDFRVRLEQVVAMLKGQAQEQRAERFTLLLERKRNNPRN